MRFRFKTWCPPLLLFLCAAGLPAQENPAKRLASIVSVAVEEYGKAFDASGRLIAPMEYAEATDFLRDAGDVAARVNSYSAAETRAILDTLTRAVLSKRRTADVRNLHTRFLNSLGASGAIDLPSHPLNPVRGASLYTANCASCHGASGMGDGAAGQGLPVRPPAIGIRDSTPDMSSSLAYNVISVGIRGTPMPSFAERLSPQERWEIVNYIYTLRGMPMELPAAPADAAATSADDAARMVMALLDSALEFARAGKLAEAGDRAFDAYIAFEPLETPARARKPGVVAAMERYFADFKGAVRKKDLAAATGARDAISSGLPQILALTRKQSGGWGTFFQSLLIILREGFEAILVVGAVVAFLIKTGHRERLRSIWIGVFLALVASAATAVALVTAFAYFPASREIVEGVTMLIAVAVLFSVSYWLISRIEAAKWQRFIQDKVTRSLDEGGGKALVLVAFLAVYREGAETALFYQALFSEGNVAVPLSLGILAGSVILAGIFTLFYRFGVRIPMRPFFTVTSVLLYYMAFVFMGKGIRELQEGNVFGITVVPGAPHIPAMGIFPSLETIGGQVLLIVLFAFAVLRSFSGRVRPDSGGTGSDVPPGVHP